MKKSNDYVRNFITIFFAQKNIISVVALTVFAGAVLFALFYPPVYAATCSIILKGSISLKSPESIEKAPVEINSIQEKDLFSEIEIINANVVAEKAVDALMAKGFPFNEAGSGKIIRKQAISKINASITPAINPRSNTITVTTMWDDPAGAKMILEAVLDSYFECRSEIFKPKEAETFFAKQLEKFSRELENKETELRNLTVKSKAPNAGAEIESNLLNMKNLERQLFDLKQSYFDQKNRVALLEKGINSPDINFFSYVNDGPLKELGNLVVEIIKQRNEAARTFHPESKKIQNYNKQIRAAIGSYKKEVTHYIDAERVELENINHKIRYIEDQIQAIRDTNINLYDNSTRSKMLERQIAVLAESYTTFTKRLEEAKINNNYKINKLFSVSLLTQPEASASPVLPNRKKSIFFGLIGGVVLGIATGFLAEFFSHTFKTPEDVENNTDMVYIFSIPK